MLKQQNGFKWAIGAAIVCLAVILFGIFSASPEKMVGKRYIFIDGGAHLGETIAHFKKSKLYSQYPWEMFAFEANPNLIPQIPKSPNLTILNKAIWTHDGGVEFYLAENTLSSSILGNKKTGKLSKTPTRVDSVDFGQWLKTNFSKDDYIFVKLDIEGAEYERIWTKCYRIKASRISIDCTLNFTM